MTKLYAFKQNNKYYLERRKEGFDLSKFTVVGSPTITEDGVASGFSTTNFLKLSSKLPSFTTFKVTGKFRDLGAFPSKGNWIFSEGLSSETWMPFGIGISVGNGRLYARIGNGSTSNTCVIAIQNNIWNFFEFSGDELSYKLRVSTDGVNFVENTVPKTVERSSDYWIPTIGVYQTGTNTYEPFGGDLDLKHFSITVDGEEVFTGAKEKFYAMEGGF